MYYVLPAIFTPNPRGGYIVKVPSVPGCVSAGATLEKAMQMIKDALCGCLCVLEDNGSSPPVSVLPNDLQLGADEFIALIEADTAKYRSEHDNRAVRRNVSLPAWLNAKAEQANVNCSQLLQEALKAHLKLTG